MSERDRKNDLDLLRKSRQALENQEAEANQPSSKQSKAEEPESDDGMMYRGRRIRRSGNGPAIPGAGKSKNRGQTQFRGAAPGRPKKPGTDTIKAHLQKLAELHSAGLITKAEYDKKRSQILDRL